MTTTDRTLVRILTVAEAEDLAVTLFTEARTASRDGYHDDARGLEVIANDLDRAISDAQENGEGVPVYADTELEGQVDAHL